MAYICEMGQFASNCSDPDLLCSSSCERYSTNCRWATNGRPGKRCPSAKRPNAAIVAAACSVMFHGNKSPVAAREVVMREAAALLLNKYQEGKNE